MKYSAGVLFYRGRGRQLEVLLVHPSGEYNKDAKWSIPKGEIEKGDTALETALCEAWEEVGMLLAYGSPKLGTIRYKSGRKEVTCYACETADSPKALSWEIDKAEWFTPEEAKGVIHPDQAEFVDSLLRLLNGPS